MGENSESGNRRSEATTEVGQEPLTSLGSGECYYSAGEVLKELSGRGYAQCGLCLVGVIAFGSHVPWELTMSSESRGPQGAYPNQAMRPLWESS